MSETLVDQWCEIAQLQARLDEARRREAFAALPSFMDVYNRDKRRYPDGSLDRLRNIWGRVMAGATLAQANARSRFTNEPKGMTSTKTMTDEDGNVVFDKDGKPIMENNCEDVTPGVNRKYKFHPQYPGK